MIRRMSKCSIEHALLSLDEEEKEADKQRTNELKQLAFTK
jgi:hypothetical protein